MADMGQFYYSERFRVSGLFEEQASLIRRADAPLLCCLAQVKSLSGFSQLS